MDIASQTIDRHEPTLPDYIQGELSLSQEHLYTKIKNQFVLRYCNVGQVKRWVKTRPTPSTIPPKIITKPLLDTALAVTRDCAGKLGATELAYLESRRLSHCIDKYGICSTAELCRHLSPDEIHHLSLRISDKFAGQVDTHVIIGISVPCFNGDDFYGFCTRVLNQTIIKYSITIPQRFCFGVDYSRPAELCVVEGVFDAMRMIDQGRNCMALGDSQPNFWKMLIANKFNQVNLLFDHDYSGMIGACKAHIILEEMLGRDPATIAILLPRTANTDPAQIDDAHNLVKITLRDLAAQLTIIGRNV